MTNIELLLAHSVRDDQTFLYLQVMERVLHEIKSSAKFHIDDYTKMARIFTSREGMIRNLFEGSLAERVRPPYPACWVSYDVSQHRLAE